MFRKLLVSTGAAVALVTGALAGTVASTTAANAATSLPCDIYGAANTPCVAAHSTVRALYAAYSGPLYQLRRASDKTTRDVPLLTPGGFADVSVQDTFCSETTCTISIIYDQSSQHNDLPVSPKTAFMP